MAEKNTGKPYELLTMRIFDEMLKQDQIETLRLEHDVILEGKTVNHQIDVYWEFRVGGVTYRNCVQAKDWAQTISQGTVMTFNQVLADLKVRPTGIMVCKSGYQRGAKNFADGNGILLYELREIREEDWTGLIRNVSVELHVLQPHFSDFKLQPDGEWLGEQMRLHNLPEGEQIYVAEAGGINIQSEDGGIIESISDALNRHLPNPLVPLPKTLVEKRFETPVFVPIPHDRLQRLKITGYTAAMTVEEEPVENIAFNGDDFVQFILKNLSDKTARFFPKDKP